MVASFTTSEVGGSTYEGEDPTGKSSPKGCDTASHDAHATSPSPLPWRTGRKALRTLYDAQDRLIGLLDHPADAALVAGLTHQLRDLRLEVERLRDENATLRRVVREDLT